ncbi:putative L-aspartate dehydrogenase [Huso huso]|uniref:L-aspartate dehydrogenase n=1 Tax=Huso huso TaxID=61971 RepID=A0ABR0Y2E2_HUSHU
MSEPTGMRRVGIVGYGHLGNFLLGSSGQTEGRSLGLTFSLRLWNRSFEKLIIGNVSFIIIFFNLFSFNRKSDLIVEVAHPQIAKDYGTAFLTHSNFMIGSPTALADSDLETRLRETAKHHGNTLYVPSGAFWGGEDIQKMADAGTLKVCISLLTDWHVVLVEVTGPEFEGSGRSFTVKTERRNPAKLGAVTGNATYQSFWSSVLVCQGHGGKVHLC